MKKSILLTSMIVIFWVIVTAFPVAEAAFSHFNQKDADDCDRYAASPIDMQKPNDVTGVPFNEIDKWKANGSCGRAVTNAPQSILPRMEFQYGRALEKMENEYAAEDKYMKAANHHYLAAYVALGWMCYAGLGKEVQNFKKAFEWYKKGAEGGNPTAMHNISIMYNKGIGVAKDKSKASYWYQKALDNGIAKTDTLSRDASEKITGFGRSYEQHKVSIAYNEAKRLALQGLHKCTEGGQKEGVLYESSIEYSEPVCEKITEKRRDSYWNEYTVGEPMYQCTAYAYGTCMHALIREENIKPKPLFNWNDMRVSYAVDLLDPNTYPRPITPESNKIARERYADWVEKIGETKILELSEKVRSAPRQRDGYYLADGGTALKCGSRDPKFCLEHLLAKAQREGGEVTAPPKEIKTEGKRVLIKTSQQVRARQYAIEMLQNGASMDIAIERYNTEVNSIGEAKVLELAEKVQNSPRRDNFYLADWGVALGCGVSNPIWCFDTLLRIEKVKQDRTKCENGDQEACTGLQKIEPSYKEACERKKTYDKSPCMILKEIHKTKSLSFN